MLERWGALLSVNHMVMCKGVTAVLGGGGGGGGGVDTKHPNIEAPMQINESIPKATKSEAICFQRQRRRRDAGMIVSAVFVNISLL